MMSSDRLETLMNQAEELLKAKKSDLAIPLFKQILQIDPKNIEALKKQADIFVGLEKYERAIDLYQQALHIDDKNIDVLRWYGKALARSGQHEQAFAIFRQALDIAPDDFDIMRTYGSFLSKAGYCDQAIEILKKSLDIQPHHVPNLNAYAQVLGQKGEYEKAFVILDLSLKIEPAHIHTFAIYTNILVKNNQYSKAFEFFRKALEHEPNNIITLNQYANLLIKNERYEEACEILERSLEINLNNVRTLDKYGIALRRCTEQLMKNEQYERASEKFDKLIKIKSNDIIILNNYANALVGTRSYEKAFEIFEQSLQIDCDNVITLSMYGRALAKAGQYETAFKLFKQSLKLEPNNVITLTNYAEALAATGYFIRATDFFKRILKMKDNDVIALNGYARVLTKLERYDKAIDIFKRLRIIEPLNIETLTNFINVLLISERYHEASQAFEHLLSIESNNLNALNKYGVILVEIRKYERACEIFERYLGIQSNSYISFRYAESLEQLGRFLEAISQLEAVELAQLPQYHANIIRLNLGRLYYRIKQSEKGNEYFEAAIANSDDKDITLLYSARSILASNPHSEKAVEMLQQIAENSPRYAQAFEMLTLNLSEEDYFDMVKSNTKTGLNDTEVLNRAMYHKIANEISILKGIAYRILRHSEQEDPLLSGIIQDIEDVFEEVDRRRAAQKSEIETIPHDHYRNILAVISKTAHDISDFVNNQLAIIESKTRRAMRKLQPHNAHYSQFEKLLTQLELTQTALSDLKAINEGITIKNHRFKVKKLFEKWETTPRIDQAQIVLDIQNGDSEFNGDEEKIKSALNELVENSLKHNSDQQNLTIRISSQDVINPLGIWGRTIPGEQKYLFIEFADNGKGIPEDRKDWIFQPLKTTSQEGKGSGLGLFIIRKTLSKMNGYIRETGRNGARFEIYIPYTKEEV
ncbi:tetratricopeptide repeat protein [Nostocales cyanobacterium LEGE 12452]|nr:tetratricopeptide repeat protein [Nostocales cyanobacterium LEGE 12452]